jgi:phage terminase large subunit
MFLYNKLPNIKNHTVWVDSSRPETISGLKRQYLPEINTHISAKGVEKGQGSVEDGIEFMKSHKMINVHPCCIKLIDNFDRYSYKTDRKGNILRDVEKKNDDGIDAIRYALEKLMKAKSIDYSK